MLSVNHTETNHVGHGCKLKGEDFFHRLSPQASAELDAMKRPYSYPTGSVLFLEKQSLRGVYFLCTGRVKLSIGSREGKTLTLRIAMPGEIIGLMAEMMGAPYEASAEALEPSEAAFIPQRDFAEFVAKYPEVYESLLRHLGAQYNRACEQLRTVGLAATAGQKLARLLLHWSEDGRKTQDGTQLTVPLTHEQIAECIGSTRETISRTLGEFRSRHLVLCKGATMTIPSLAALERVGGI